MLWSLLRCVPSRKFCSYTCLHIFWLTEMLMRNTALVGTMRNCNNYWTPERKWVSVTDLSVGFPVRQKIHTRNFEGWLGCTHVLGCEASSSPGKHPVLRSQELSQPSSCPPLFCWNQMAKSPLAALHSWEVLDLMGLQTVASTEMVSSFIYSWHCVQLRAPHCSAVLWGLDICLMPAPNPSHQCCLFS